MNPLLTAALLVVGLGLFGYSAITPARAPCSRCAATTGATAPGSGSAALLRFGFGQQRLVDPEERVAGRAPRRPLRRLPGARAPDHHALRHRLRPRLPPAAARPRLGARPRLRYVKDVVVWAALLAALGFLWRRLVTRPARVTASWEGTLVLGFILGADGDRDPRRACRLARAPAGAPPRPWRRASFWLHLAIILAFLNFLPFGKHFHVITALPNVFFRAPPARGATLRKLDLETEERFGAATVADLTWKEALDVYSCTECGRCQTHCPTYVTGKPLTHKEREPGDLQAPGSGQRRRSPSWRGAGAGSPRGERGPSCPPSPR